MVVADLQTYKINGALGPQLRCAPEKSGYLIDEYDPRMNEFCVADERVILMNNAVIARRVPFYLPSISLSLLSKS
jgi:hypothetical protein